MLKQHPRQVKIVFKHYPLRNHAWALPAAKAAVVADHHGKFWEFHDLLLKNYNKLDESKIEEIAASLGLDPNALKEEMNTPQVTDKVNADLKNGREAGVRGTPTVFINGVALRNLSERGFQRGISEALRELEDKGNN